MFVVVVRNRILVLDRIRILVLDRMGILKRETQTRKIENEYHIHIFVFFYVVCISNTLGNAEFVSSEKEISGLV